MKYNNKLQNKRISDEKKIKLEYIKSENNLADSLTKYLNRPLLKKFSKMIFWQLREN